jgi:hypothetical protein
VDFAFRSQLYGHVADMFFSEVVQRMMGAFESRCAQLYGPSSLQRPAAAAQQQAKQVQQQAKQVQQQAQQQAKVAPAAAAAASAAGQPPPPRLKTS